MAIVRRSGGRRTTAVTGGRGEPPRGDRHPRREVTVAERHLRWGPALCSYRASRFTFIFKHIEPLAPGQAFRMVTDDGTFQMTKADFYRDFAAITRTDSYRLHGRYNRAKPPKSALVYKVERCRKVETSRSRPRAKER